VLIKHAKKYLLPLILLAPLLLAARQDNYDLVKGWEIRMGMGYVNTMPEMNRIWSDGFAWEMITVGYKPCRFFGFETGFIMGLTGMQKNVIKKVPVYYPATGETGTQESSGGAWGGIPFGGRFSFRLFHSPVVLAIGAGGLYGFEEESGISADGYDTRMTKGFGYYILASAHIMNPSVKNPGGFGIQFRYIGGYADAMDFNYSLGIPSKDPHSLMEGRLLITADLFIDFKSRDERRTKTGSHL
jgi:hypothetical protein